MFMPSSARAPNGTVTCTRATGVQTRQKKHRPLTPDQASTTGGAGDGRGSGWDREAICTVAPLSPAERRARKARARVARIEESRIKKEMALRNEKLAELDRQDNSKNFNIKVVIVSACRIYRRRGKVLTLVFTVLFVSGIAQ